MNKFKALWLVIVLAIMALHFITSCVRAYVF